MDPQSSDVSIWNEQTRISSRFSLHQQRPQKVSLRNDNSQVTADSILESRANILFQKRSRPRMRKGMDRTKDVCFSFQSFLDFSEIIITSQDIDSSSLCHKYQFKGRSRSKNCS